MSKGQAAIKPRRGQQGRMTMKRYAIPLASVLCLALWACAQLAPPPAPPPPGPGRTVTSVITCLADGHDLLTHVHYTLFTPPPASSAPSPISDSTVPPSDATSIDPSIQQDLAVAFGDNPGFAQNKLCTLDGIYINRCSSTSYDPSSCSTMKDSDVADNSWGFRTPEPSVHRYVAISLGLWRCPTGSTQTFCAPPFQDYRNRVVGAVLDRTARSTLPASFKPTYQVDPTSNTSGMSVLAALAHETGHIYWWDTFVNPPGAPSISKTTTFCTPTVFYPGGYWEGAPVDIPTGRFVTFAEQNQNSVVVTANLPTLLQAGSSDLRPAGEVVHGVYHSGRYSSLLAAYSPDEDFVEAFELSVLRKGPLRNVTVNVTGYSPHQDPILANGTATNQAAEAKLQCFDPVSLLSPPPR